MAAPSRTTERQEPQDAAQARRLRVLVLADDCNPDWPSLPIVGYRFALALGRLCDVTVATHVRNRANIEKAGQTGVRFEFADTEYIAAPLYKAAKWLRGGTEVAWSTNMAMAYPAYLAFEREVWKMFRDRLDAGAFDIVHRITPMSPTLPSYIAGRCPVPFAIGPLNGNLDWPAAFRAEQKREREMLRTLRNVYKYLPFARSTYAQADLVLAAFDHTARDLSAARPETVIDFPEAGFDPAITSAEGRRPAFCGPGPYRFCFVGRLVPYKVPEIAVRAFAESEILKDHVLHVVGKGPEQPRLEAIVAAAGAQDRILFEGAIPHGELSAFLRGCDGFVFPSIRELGAVVVVEAMASGCACFVTDYGAPGALCGDGRGTLVPLSPLDALVAEYRRVLEEAVQAPAAQTARAASARRHAEERYAWDRKAERLVGLYRDMLAGRPFPDRGPCG